MPRSRNTGPAAAPQPARAAPSRHNRSTKQKQLRARLLQTGLDMFRRDGFDAVTVAQIADAAQISRRSFFRYFSSKEDLVFDWIAEQRHFMAQSLAERAAAGRVLPAVRAAMIELARRMDAEPAQAIQLIRIAFETPALDRRFNAEIALWEDLAIDIIGKQHPLPPRSEFSLRIQIAAGTAAFLGALRAWTRVDHRDPLQKWVELAYGALQDGFRELGWALPAPPAKPRG